MKTLLLTLLIAAGSSAAAQTAAGKLYGFQQKISGGQQKAVVLDEYGQATKERPAQKTATRIYFETALTTRIYPVQMWVNGEAYHARLEPVRQRPVTSPNAAETGGAAQVLIAESSKALYLVTPAPLVAHKAAARAEALAGNNSVVLLYKQSGKMRYAVLKKFTALQPAAMQ